MSTSDFPAAFRVLLGDSLNVSPEDEVLVIYDETLLPFWGDLLPVLFDQGCPSTLVCLPARFQQRLSRQADGVGEVRLPTGLLAAILEADVIITILSGDINLASVRRSIVSRASGLALRGRRLAHIPGISREVLEVLTQSQIDVIEQRCEMLAWALGEGRTAVLSTTEASGTRHQLACDLGGWYNEPLMSPGVIYHDSWGNVPPGETFCCPAPLSVNGTIVINGSVPGYVCQHGDEVVLQFSNGKLVRWTTSVAPLNDFFDRQAALAKERHDPEWNTFAELGIGANPAVAQLTGNSLFDEKAYGTVHIAIGDNSGFGHTVSSQIHADLVTRSPTFSIDDRLIIERGAMLADVIAEWRSHLRIAPVKADTLDRMHLRMETFGSTQRWRDAFCRRLHSRGRTGYVRIAEGEDAQLLHRLTGAITADDWQVPSRALAVAETLGVSGPVFGRLLAKLVHYQMVNVAPDPLIRENDAHA